MHPAIECHNEDVDLKSFSEHRSGVLMESGSIGRFSLKRQINLKYWFFFPSMILRELASKQDHTGRGNPNV
jgi:hypothetical protein